MSASPLRQSPSTVSLSQSQVDTLVATPRLVELMSTVSAHAGVSTESSLMSVDMLPWPRTRTFPTEIEDPTSAKVLQSFIDGLRHYGDAGDAKLQSINEASLKGRRGYP
jgi:hypothetical protein